MSILFEQCFDSECPSSVRCACYYRNLDDYEIPNKIIRIPVKSKRKKLEAWCNSWRDKKFLEAYKI